MAFTIANFSPESGKCKDLIIKSLSGSPALSAKKIYLKVKTDFQTKVSYQAVHKSLGLLANANILKKFNNEYYLSQEWVGHIHSFIEDLKEKRAIITKDANEQPLEVNYARKLTIKPTRFVPFYLGLQKFNARLPQDCKIFDRGREKISFSWRGNTYSWYKTGVCVQVIDEKEKLIGIVDLLLERRKKHHELLEFKSRAAKDILEMMRVLDPKAKPRLSYVMSIHAVNFLEKVSYFENMLRLITEPGFLGIHDNPELAVGEQQVFAASRKLADLECKELQFSSVYEMAIDQEKKTFASWSNVVFSSGKSDLDYLSNQLVGLETELQHLWFYFHHLKNDLRKEMRRGEMNKLKELLGKQKGVVLLWSEFENIGAREDAYTQLLKKGLIKTSRIEKIYAELQNLFSSCRLKMESDPNGL